MSIGANALIAVTEANLLWLSKHRDYLETACRLLVPSYPCLSRLTSKMNQIEIAKEAGFDILPTSYLTKASDCATVPANWFPICLRPSEPAQVSPQFKAQLIYSRNELADFLDRMQEIRQPILSQPFLHLPDLKVHGIRSVDGRILAMQPFFVERKFEGVTLTLMRSAFPPGIRECCERFAEIADLTGGFHFDLLYSPKEDRVYYLEINARMGGITDKAKAFGYDQPRLILEAYGHPRTETPSDRGTSRKRVVTKRAVVKHILKALSGQLTELDYPPVGRTKHVLLSTRDLILARDSVFDRKDLLGSLWFNLQKPA